MKFKIDGSYVNGTDIGHPDGVDIFTACCCGFVAGDTSEKRDANARLVVAAPEMLELLRDVRQYVVDANLRSDGYAEIDLKAIDALLAKIEGGGNE